MAFIVPDWTFPYFYFEILFCQNKVKKNRKSVPRVFFKNTDIRRGKRHRKYEYGVHRRFTGFGNVDLLSRRRMCCHGFYHHSLL